jgi:xanthine dehydrogenase accessory factor
MIASRRKADRLREVMRMRGVDEVQLARLTAPAGPDAGAKAPGEIALVAIVGVLAILRGRVPSTANPLPPPTADDPAASALRTLQSHANVTAVSRNTFINPVCGIAVDTAAPKHIETYEGVAFYFCCDCCLVTFRQDPAKYAAIHRVSAGRTSV